MRRILKPLVLISVVLAVPVVPLLFLGLSFEDRVTAWLGDAMSADESPVLHFALIVGVLATDIFLPIPSSAVSTYAGGSGLGFWAATGASWLGMTAGASLGFGLARIFGHRFTDRYAKTRDLHQMAALSQRYGPLALVLTRALPILAESCVLLMGATGLSWRRFVLPVIASNLVISATYAACGVFFEGSGGLLYAVIASGTIPLGAALLARRWLPALGLELFPGDGDAESEQRPEE